MTIPLPSQASTVSDLAATLDNASPEDRLAWIYSLGDKEQLKLFEMAKGHAPLTVEDVVGEGDGVNIHTGRNGLAFFNRFEKRFARLGDQTVGYNHNESIGGPLNFLMVRITGPGHYTAYNAPDGDGIWIDYRVIPKVKHPTFPPLIDNDHGLRSLVFGNMVDVLRRVSKHVLIGNAFKDKGPAATLGSRIGSRFPTAPFVLLQKA